MSKRKFLIPFATFGLLLSCLVACGGGNNESKPNTSAGDDSSQEAGGSSEQGGGASSQEQGGSSSEQGGSSSQGGDSSQEAHEHDYQQVGEAVKNADGKDVKLFECKDKDDKYLAVAFDDYSAKSADFGSASSYNHVPEALRNESRLIAKNATVTWKVNVDKAIQNADLMFGVVYTGSDHGTQGAADGSTMKYSIKANDGDFADWDLPSGATYDGLGLSQTERAYIRFGSINLQEGENTITLRQNNAGYRLLFGGEMRIHYSGDAKPVEAPFPGYDITFSVEHCKVFVYSTKAYTTETPVETLTAKAKNELGEIVPYDVEDLELQPQVSFKVVCDEGYSCTVNNVSVTPADKFKNLKQNPDNVEGQDDIYRVTKIQDNLTITIAPVQGEQAPGYKVTFAPENCEVKVYVGPKDDTGSNLDTPQEGGFYYARLKDSPYDVGYTTPQVNFEVVCNDGYEFVPEIVDDKVSFISGDYNKFQLKNGVYNITKIASDLTITIKAVASTQIAQPVGNFSGYAVSAQDGSNIFVDIALANDKAFIEVGSLLKDTKAFTFNKETGLLTIDLGAYGTLTATYDEANNKLNNCGIEGAAAAYLSNNNSIELKAAENYWNCDGTTEELLTQFQRRYRTANAGWNFDNSNADRIQSDTTNFVSGTGAMKIRPYKNTATSGDTSAGVVGLSLKSDFAQAKALKNIGFWVYNSSDVDIPLRTWVYTQTGLAGASEIGGLTAKANGWTYCRMGFEKTIYNFNISNWNNSANALVFDDIVLF